MGTEQHWLAELDQYGNASLIDGPHPDRAGVEQAAYLLERLGLKKGRRFAAAHVLLSEVEAKPHDTNEDALATLNAAGLRP
jgi:hypothetical protein